MRQVVSLDITGLGIIFYSPANVRHIQPGDDYLRRWFWRPEDVAGHVNACQLSTFCTGSSGTFHVHVHDGTLDLDAVTAADCRIRLGIQVRDGALCFGDLYELIDWVDDCPREQRVELASGFYRITVWTSTPVEGRLGDDQHIGFHVEPWPTRPPLVWTGVPDLIPPSQDSEPSAT